MTFEEFTDQWYPLHLGCYPGFADFVERGSPHLWLEESYDAHFQSIDLADAMDVTRRWYRDGVSMPYGQHAYEIRRECERMESIRRCGARVEERGELHCGLCHDTGVVVVAPDAAYTARLVQIYKISEHEAAERTNSRLCTACRKPEKLTGGWYNPWCDDVHECWRLPEFDYERETERVKNRIVQFFPQLAEDAEIRQAEETLDDWFDS